MSKNDAVMHFPFRSALSFQRSIPWCCCFPPFASCFSLWKEEQKRKKDRVHKSRPLCTTTSQTAQVRNCIFLKKQKGEKIEGDPVNPAASAGAGGRSVCNLLGDVCAVLWDAFCFYLFSGITIYNRADGKREEKKEKNREIEEGFGFKRKRCTCSTFPRIDPHVCSRGRRSRSGKVRESREQEAQVQTTEGARVSGKWRTYNL